MAKKKTRSFDVDSKHEVALTIIELDPVRAKLGRFLLALIGLRNVLFISAKDPIQYVKVNEPKEETPVTKKKAAKKKVN